MARFPEFESSPDDCAQDIRVDREPRRLPAVSDDVCKLPEASGLFQHRDHEGKTVNGGTGGPAVFSPVLISHILTQTYTHTCTQTRTHTHKAKCLLPTYTRRHDFLPPPLFCFSSPSVFVTGTVASKSSCFQKGKKRLLKLYVCYRGK